MGNAKLIKMLWAPCDLTAGWRLLSQFFVAAVFATAAIHLVSFATQTIFKIGWIRTLEVIAIGLSVFAGVTLWPLLWKISRLPSRSGLLTSLGQYKSEVSKLEKIAADQETKAAHFEELADAHDQRYELVLNTFNISTFHSDLSHRYTWCQNGFKNGLDLVGKFDHEIFDPIVAHSLTSLKQKAITDGETQNAQINLALDNKMRHFLVQCAPRHNRSGDIIGTVSVSSDITERVEWQAKSLLLLREVNHRSRNLLSIVSAICMQTARTADHMEDYRDRLIGRITSLSKSIQIITEDLWSESSLMQTFQAQIEVFPTGTQSRIRIHADDVRLNHKTTQNMGLAFHELLSNARRYGALSVSNGMIDVTWSIVEQAGGKMLQFRWKETGVKLESPPVHRGFGLRALENVLANELGGHAYSNWQDDGLLHVAEFPIE